MEKIKKRNLNDTIGWLLLILSAIGLLASFVLSVEAFNLARDPNHKAICDINPVISCGSINDTEQSAVFGFPNPFIGIISYTVLLTVGAALVAGATFKRWFWLGMQVGASLGVLFIHWLIFQSIYEIGALCPYCMVSWVVTIPIFWYVTLFNIRNKHIVLKGQLKEVAKFAERNHGNVLFIWFSIIALLILQHFWYYWKTLV